MKNTILQNPINHMLQGLAHWMAYRDAFSNIQVVEADAVFVATDILRANLPTDYIVEKEITNKSLAIVKGHRIDIGIKYKIDGTYKCLIEFKLADATNGGYKSDVQKLSVIKETAPDIDCFVVLLYRKSCAFIKPKELVDKDGKARRGIQKVGKKSLPIKVRRVCNSFSSKTNKNSKKTICLEVL